MCTTEGKVAAATTITIPFAGYIGNSRAACSVVASDLPNGISVTSNSAGEAPSSSYPEGRDGSLVLTAAANSTLGGNDTGTITLTFTCNSKNFVKKFAWSKVIPGAQGPAGAAGANTAMVYLYGRFADAPTSKPYSSAVTYTFSTGTLSTIPTGWSQSVPSGTNPLYVSTAVVSGTGTTASIAANKWTTPTKFAQDGTNGTNGVSVISIMPLYYLTISATAPSAPSTNHDNESTYPNPDIDVWTKFMPDYRTQEFQDLIKRDHKADFPETGEENTIYQNKDTTNDYYI